MNKKYYKIIGNKTVFYNGVITAPDGASLFNPPEDIILENGWMEYIEQTPTNEELANRRLISEINELKQLLADEDYKIIKCAESFMTGTELPYNLNELIEERNIKRARINEIEELLK